MDVDILRDLRKHQSIPAVVDEVHIHTVHVTDQLLGHNLRASVTADLPLLLTASNVVFMVMC